MASKTLSVDSIQQMQNYNGQSECVQNGTLTDSDTLYENNYSTGDIDQQKEIIHNSQMNGDGGDDGVRPIIVTGFGGISPGDSNITTYVMQEFFRKNNGFFDYNSEQIPILTGSPDMMKDHNNLQPVEVSYKFVREPPFDPWLRFTKARLTVHLGTKDSAHGNEILFEHQASNGGPRFWTQDNYGPIFNERCVPEDGLCACRKTAFKIWPTLIDKVQERVSSHIGSVNFSFQESTDAGTFLCDFLYYRSLYYASQRDDGKENVLLIHIPTAKHLSNGITPEILASVLEQIVYCLLDMCSGEGERETTPLPRTIENGYERLTSGVEKQDEESCVCKGAFVPQNGYQESALSSCYQYSCIADQENHKDQHDIISHPLKPPNVIKNVIVLTGFDPVYKTPNQSWKIVQKFCTLFQKDGNFDHNSIPFQLETGPVSKLNRPVITTYSYVTSHSFDDWLRSSDALLYIHLGTNENLNTDLEPGNVFSFETIAANGDANFWRKDKSLQKFHGPCIEGGEDTLLTPFSDNTDHDKQLNDLFSRLSKEVAEEKINGTFNFQLSNDAGHFLCDFLYYRSLYYAALRNEASVDGKRSYVIFIHVPSKLKPSNLAAVAPMALVLNLIVHGLLDIILSSN